MRVLRLRARSSCRLAGAVVALCFLCGHAARALCAEEVYDVNVLDQEFAAAVRDNPRLQGAWIDIDYEPNADEALSGRFIIRCVLDSSRAAQQRVEIDRLLRAWLPQGNYQVKPRADRFYPFAHLLADLELAIETDPSLGGCQLTGGYYAADPNEPGSLNLMLRGRLVREDQDVAIEALCGRLMRRHPSWVKPGAGKADAASQATLAIAPNTTELSVVEPSEANGRWFYAAGLRQFWRLDYARAAQSFHQASLESPRKIQYHYWWILSDLAQGKGQLARRRMDMVVRRFREEDFDHQSPEYRLVVRSLERVQGPLRHALQRLETESLFGNAQRWAQY